MNPAGISSGANVTTGGDAALGEHLLVLRVGTADHRLVVHPRLAGRQERPFEVDAENARIDGAARRTASSAARILAGVSVMSVGSSAVVPNRRWAAAIAASPRAWARH